MTTFVFHITDGEGAGPVEEFGAICAEIESRGHGSLIVRSPRYFGSPHQERADAVAKALADFTDDVAIVGISNQGLFLPLVADARPHWQHVVVEVGHDPERAADHQRHDQHAEGKGQDVVGVVRARW
jgi:hypothetical protein